MTRYAVVSDIHGNLHALRAVLRATADDGVDGYICAGDTVGYGPFPGECVEALTSLGAVTVVGNHELMVLGQLPDERFSPTVQDSVRWTRAHLGEPATTVISQWPSRARVADVAVTHGSLQSREEYVRGAEQAEAQLDELRREAPDARILVLGHTHEQWAYAAGEGTIQRARAGLVQLGDSRRYLLNPGSVGQSRDRSPHARYLVLDLGRRTADFRSIPYDVAGCQDALRARGRPPGSCHYRPDRLERPRAAARRLIRTVLP